MSTEMKEPAVVKNGGGPHLSRLRFAVDATGAGLHSLTLKSPDSFTGSGKSP